MLKSKYYIFNHQTLKSSSTRNPAQKFITTNKPLSVRFHSKRIEMRWQMGCWHGGGIGGRGHNEKPFYEVEKTDEEKKKLFY